MKRIIASACAAVSLTAIVSVAKAEETEIYYAGAFVCADREYATNWTVTQALGGSGIDAKVFYQRDGSNEVQWIDVSEQMTADGNTLNDANGNPRIKVVADGDTIKGTWMRGAPSSQCSPFSVTRSESPKARFDKLFALMEIANPDEKAAAEVADQTRFPPTVYALPELDQQAYLTRYNELKEQFWKNYRDALDTAVANAPLDTAEQRREYANRINSMLSGSLQFALARGDFEPFLKTVQQAADRYAATGSSPAVDMYAGGKQTCQRLDAILKSDPYFNFGKLELAAGVPADYWTRELAEDLLAGLRGCASSEVPKDYAQQLTSKWPTIQKQQQQIQQLRQEQARLLALPVTLATFVETKNLHPDETAIKGVSEYSDLYKRFFGSSLDTRREELLNASLASFAEEAANYTLDKPDVSKSITDVCDSLRYDSSLSDEKRETVNQACETATETIAKKQITDAEAKIATAFESVEPGSEQAKAAIALCEELPSTLVSDARTEIYRACSSAKAELTNKEEALKCEKAVADSGASSSLLGSTIEVRESDGSSKVSLKELVCSIAKRDVKVSFDSTGYLAWKKQLMNLQLPRVREGEGPLHFVLNPSETGADWALSVEDEETKDELRKQRVKTELVTACFMGKSVCQP